MSTSTISSASVAKGPVSVSVAWSRNFQVNSIVQYRGTARPLLCRNKGATTLSRPRSELVLLVFNLYSYRRTPRDEAGSRRFRADDPLT